jgi:hypothetical protein
VSDRLVLAVTELHTEETGEISPRDTVDSRLETARDRLAEKLDASVTVAVDISELSTHSSDAVDHAARVEELREEIAALVGDASEVDDLAKDERRRLEKLREQYHFHEELQEARTTPDYAPALVVRGVTDVPAETVATAVFDPLEPLDPTVVVGDNTVEPFTEAAIAEAVAAVSSPSAE